MLIVLSPAQTIGKYLLIVDGIVAGGAVLMLTLLVGLETAYRFGNHGVGVSGDVVQDALAGLVGGRGRGPAEDDDGDEEQGCGEEQGPEVGKQGQEARGQQDEAEEGETEDEGEEEVEPVLQEGRWDRHGRDLASAREMFSAERERE